MRGDRKSRFARSQGCCLNHLPIEFVQWRTVDADLDEARLYAIEARAGLSDPASRELLGGFGSRKGRQILVIGGGVETCVGPNLDPNRVTQTTKQGRITPEKVRCALLKKGAAEPLHLFEIRPRNTEDFIAIIAARPDLVGDNEIDHDVFVHKNGFSSSGERGRGQCREQIAPGKHALRVYNEACADRPIAS